MDFSISTKYIENEDYWLIDVNGEIDIFNSSEFKTILLNLLEEKPADIKINCANLSYIDSTALGALIAVLKKAKSFKKDVCLKNVKASLSKLFKITNLDKVFIIEGDVNE